MYSDDGFFLCDIESKIQAFRSEDSPNRIRRDNHSSYIKRMNRSVGGLQLSGSTSSKLLDTTGINIK